MGCVKPKCVFEHAQTVRIHIILYMRNVTFAHFLSTETSFSFQWPCLLTAKAQIRRYGCAGWSGSSLSEHARRPFSFFFFFFFFSFFFFFFFFFFFSFSLRGPNIVCYWLYCSFLGWWGLIQFQQTAPIKIALLASEKEFSRTGKNLLSEGSKFFREDFFS